jgi:hypothetical protein
MEFRHIFPMLALLGVMVALSLRTGHALSTGEIAALQDMQQQWGSQLGWTGQPSCSWQHVRCDASQHVVSLTFVNLPLGGSLPASLGELMYVQSMAFSNCSLTGGIPSSLANLTRLVELGFASNHLSGL